MRVSIDLPDAGVNAQALLYADAAPGASRFVWDALATPLDTLTSHACFDGHEIYCFLAVPPAMGPPPEPENISLRPRPGDLMYFHAAAGKFAAVSADARLRGPTPDVHELAFIYGEVDLRHYWEEGWVGSIVGHVDQGLTEFADACLSTLTHGRTRLIVTRFEEPSEPGSSHPIG